MSGTDSHRVDKKGGIYVASRVSRADIWRNLRDNMGIAITSSWIDEAGEGETADFGELWTRIQREISSSTGLVFYADVSDAPWKGALVEIGMALAMGKPIGVVLIGELEGRTLRPIGSWLHHPSVKVCAFIEDAIDHAQAGASAASETGTTDAKDVTIKHWCKRALDAEADAAAVRELMNVYNLGGWTDAVAPMKRALKAEADLKALGDNLELLRARMVLATDDEIMRQESAASEGSHTANRSENMSDELPGMLAVAEGVAKQEWPHTMDAQVWAREFDKMYPMLWRDGDAISDVEGVMLSLLANAIMAGYDTANARRSETRPTYEDGLEDAARICDEWGLDQNFKPYTGPEYSAHEAIALKHADNLAEKIRALKKADPQATAAPSESPGALNGPVGSTPCVAVASEWRKLSENYHYEALRVMWGAPFDKDRFQAMHLRYLELARSTQTDERPGE